MWYVKLLSRPGQKVPFKNFRNAWKRYYQAFNHTQISVCDLDLRVPITSAADNIHKYFFNVFQRKTDLIFQVNPLLG